MFNKFAVGLTVAALLIGGSFSTTQAQGITIEQLVKLFIDLGIIAPDKAAAAKAAVSTGGAVSGPSVSTDVAPIGSSCEPLLTRDLTVGSSGADVKVLQNQLGIFPGSSYFGTYTQEEVKKFQATYGIVSNGYVGPETRAKFNAIYGCKSAETSIIKPTTSLGLYCIGEAFYKASPQVVWNAVVSGGTGGYTYSWSIYGDVEKYPGGSTQSAMVTAEYRTTGTKEAVIRVTDQAGATATASCKNSVSETVGQSMKVMYPTAGLLFSAGGKIDVAFTNPTFGQQYKVAIRGKAYEESLGSVTAQAADQLKTSFILPVSIPAGSYNIVVYGFATEIYSPSFTVTNSTSNQSMITVLSPNGGTYSWTDTIPVKVTSKNIKGMLYVYLRDTAGTIFAQKYSDSGNITNAYISFGPMKDVTGGGIKAGTYLIQVCDGPYSMTSYCIVGDKFSLTTGSPSPSVTLVSPNGGETIQVGAYIPVTFTTTMPVGTKYEVALVGKAYDGQLTSGVVSASDKQVIYVTVPNTTGDSYRIRVNKTDCSSDCVQDQSDSNFTITGLTTSSCTDSDGGININVAGITDGRVGGLGSYFNDSSVNSYGGACSGESCTGVAEGYCSNGQVTNIVYQCPSGYSVGGACATKSVAAQPTISLISPASGETLTAGQNYVIRWSAQNIPSNAAIVINVFNGTSGSITNPNYQIVYGLPSYNTSYTWNVSGNTGSWGLGLEPSLLDKITRSLGVKVAQAASNQYVIGIGVIVNGVEVASANSGVFTINQPQPVVTGSASVSASPSSISSGGSAKLNFTWPSDTVKAQVYLYCPSGVSGTGCNAYTTVTSNSDYTFILSNSTNQSQNVVPNYYVYSSSNPNYANGVSTQITVQAGAQATAAAPAAMVSPSLSSYSWYADDSSTWPTVSTPSTLNSNQAIRVKGLGGEQYFDKALGVNSGKLTSSPPAGTTQLILYVYDYGQGNYAVSEKTVNVTVTNSSDETSSNYGGSNLGSAFVSLEDIMKLINVLR